MASGGEGPEDRLAGVRQREEAAGILLRKAQQLRLKGTVGRWVGEWVGGWMGGWVGCRLEHTMGQWWRGEGLGFCLFAHMDTRAHNARYSV